jgi:hypothetical protein
MKAARRVIAGTGARSTSKPAATPRWRRPPAWCSPREKAWRGARLEQFHTQNRGALLLELLFDPAQFHTQNRGALLLELL